MDELGRAMMQQKKRSAKTEGKTGEHDQKVQAGVSLSEGSGVRTGASGPESRKRSKQKDEAGYSRSLPSPEKIAKVLC